jgi:hypothetical protein
MRPKLKYYTLFSVWTFAVLLFAGAILNLVRNYVYGIPLFPLRRGLIVFIIFAIMAAGIVGVSILRAIFVRTASDRDVEG